MSGGIRLIYSYSTSSPYFPQLFVIGHLGPQLPLEPISHIIYTPHTRRQSFSTVQTLLFPSTLDSITGLTASETYYVFPVIFINTRRRTLLPSIDVVSSKTIRNVRPTVVINLRAFFKRLQTEIIREQFGDLCAPLGRHPADR